MLRCGLLSTRSISRSAIKSLTLVIVVMESPHCSSTVFDFEKTANKGDALTLKAPADVHQQAWCICLLLGVGILTPWNILINAFDLFNALYPGTSFEVGCLSNLMI